MDVTATLKIKINQLGYKEAYTYNKVFITVCSTSVAITATALYFKKENYQTKIHMKMLDGSLLFGGHTTKWTKKISKYSKQRETQHIF